MNEPLPGSDQSPVNSHQLPGAGGQSPKPEVQSLMVGIAGLNTHVLFVSEKGVTTAAPFTFTARSMFEGRIWIMASGDLSYHN